MSTIAENLQVIYDIKENIKTAIESKGVGVGETPFTDYASKINEITVGGDCEGVYQNGYDNGRSDGYNEGYDNGYTIGYNQGMGQSVKPIIKVGETGIKFGFSTFATVPYYYDFSGYIDCSSMFRECHNLETIPEMTATTITDTSRMFESCIKLQTIPMLDTGSVRNMGRMFYGCINLDTIPWFDTSNVIDMTYMFADCYNFQVMQDLNTSNVFVMEDMFNGCGRLEFVPLLDTSSVVNTMGMFNGCTSLTYLDGFNGLTCDLDLSASDLITSDSMINVFNTIGDVILGKTISISQTVADRLSDEDLQIAINKNWIISIK